MSGVGHAIRVVDYVERLNNTQTGNPRYAVHFTDGTIAQTKSDAAFVPAIQDISMRYPNEVCVMFNNRGTIADMRPKEMD